jgi:hypothetical protein
VSIKDGEGVIMRTFEDNRELLSRLLRNLVWQSFEHKFSVPVSIPGVYGVFLEAIEATQSEAHDRMHAHTGRRYTDDELYLLNLGPCIREEQLLIAMLRPEGCSAGLISWEVTDMGSTPFKVWFVHH